MATLVAQKPTADAPVVLSFVPATNGGDQFANTGRERLHVKNDAGAPINVTITAQKTCSQGFLHHSVQPVAAGAVDILGPFEVFRFNDTNNRVQITYSSVTNITVALEG
jgi:hypothetical protein